PVPTAASPDAVITSPTPPAETAVAAAPDPPPQPALDADAPASAAVPPHDPEPSPPAAQETTPPPAASGHVGRDVWDAVRPTLKGMVKAVYAPAEYVSGGAGTMTLSLPNDTHRDKCEQHREVVESALAGHVGSPVAVDLTVGAAGGGPSGGGAPSAVGARVEPATSATSSPPARPPSTPVAPDVDRSASRPSASEARSTAAPATAAPPGGGDPGLRVAGGGAVAAAWSGAAPQPIDPEPDSVTDVDVDPAPESVAGVAVGDSTSVVSADAPDLHVVASDGREIAERARRSGADDSGDLDGGDLDGGDAAPWLELPDDAEVDLDDLVDVPPENVATPLDRLAEAFPGSELVDDDELY
ncbi:MAG: hypothetical protein AAF945_11920, partial [Actinomycetota bacterium]